MPMAHYPTPGLRLLTTLPEGPVRGIRQVTTGAIYAVAGNSLYQIDPDTLVSSFVGSLGDGLKTPVSMADNGLDMVIVNGSSTGWDLTLATGAFAVINDPNGMFSGADRVDYLDTYLIFNKPNTPQFYISGSLAVTFDTLDFADKESYSDLLVTIIVARRLIYLLGERTTEIWYDSGAVFSTSGSDASTVASSGFQFSQLPSVFIDHGCAAKYSVANYDNGIYWLTSDRQGHGIVMKADNYVTTRVSTFAIEAEIAGYARIDDAIGFCYQLAGHSFYVLTFPHADHTWVYDISTKLWHEWAWIDSNGTEHRHRANCYWACNGIPVVGDWQNGNLYALDNTVFTDNGQPIKRVRTYPHMLADGKRVFYRQFLADIEAGTSGVEQVVAVPAGPLLREDAPYSPYLREDGSYLNREDNPEVVAWVSLRWSDDRGRTFGNPVLQDAGATGQYLTSVQWQRLGYARDRVWELSWSTPVLRALQGAWIDASPGVS
jgi:Phage stabilisation protein